MSADFERLDVPGDFMASSPSPPTSEILHTPRLDVCEIDSSPFSHNFSDLLDGLGFAEGDESPDVSYYLENITNIKDIMPDWQHDDIEEIVVMTAKRPSILPTIKEDRNEVSHRIPTAVLGDFSFDGEDRFSGSATYCRCIRRDTGTVYALKQARANLGSTIRERSILEVVAEKGVPFVAHLQWAFQDGEHSYWVIEHYEKGSLFEYVQCYGPLDSVRTVFFASEVIVALSSLHRIGIICQGLNPNNVMFGSDGHVVLSDFSHADFECSVQQCGMPKKLLAAIMPEYIAPETVLGWARNAAVDWWSFGALVFFMVFGTHPFGKTSSTDYICDRIVKFAIPSDSLRFISPIARDLISKCLQRNPAIRLTEDKIKRHPYFSSIDWHTVSSNRVDVPSIPISSPAIALTKDSQRNRLFLHAPLLSPDPIVDSDHRVSFSSPNGHQRRQSIVNVISQNDVPKPSVSFKPAAVKILVPSIVAEEDEATSESGASGRVALQEGLDPQPDQLQKAERMAHFWDTLDKEEGRSVSSAPSQEFGELGTRTGKTPKLRKHRSSIQPRQLRFNFSTSSFQLRLKRKPRSTGALRDPIPKPTQEAVDLPNGLHKLGSGIGFTYNMPAQAPSQLSVHSFTPSCGQNFFQSGFSVKNLGRGFGTRKVKAKSASNSSGSAVAPLPTATDQESLTGTSVRPLRLREAGRGTFMQDIYRTPSWILSPPDCLPSPMALVIGGPEVCDSTSPQTSCEPLTPATLVNVDMIEDDDEVNISIPKDLDIEFVSNGAPLSLAPDSTLRLVPQSAARLSFGEDVDTSFFSFVSLA